MQIEAKIVIGGECGLTELTEYISKFPDASQWKIAADGDKFVATANYMKLN